MAPLKSIALDFDNRGREAAKAGERPDYKANVRAPCTDFGDILRSSGPIAMTGERL